MKFRDPFTYTFSHFEEDALKALKEIKNIDWELTEIKKEDSLPFINIVGKKVIKPKEALKILEHLQKCFVEDVLFVDLSGRELTIAVNGKFALTVKEWEKMNDEDFDVEYAFDFGCSIDKMKEEYGLQ